MRSYTKLNPEKPVLEQKQQNSNIDASTFAIKDAGINYRKEDGVQSPKSFIVIVSGGESRERDYFKRISNKDLFKRIKLDFVPEPRQPKNYLEKAIYKKEHYATSQKDKPDQIYILSDVDDYIGDLLKIKPQCEQLGIHLIISNPCFEIWLYYGKYNIRPIDFIIPQNSSKISHAFKTYLGQKIRGGVNPNKAIFDIENAIINAKSVYQEDANEIPDLFSTNMFHLAENILPFIVPEIKQVIDEINQKDAGYRKIFNSENQVKSQDNLKPLIIDSVTNLEKEYQERIVPALIKEFNYTSIMQVPILKKIVINQGLGEAMANRKIIDVAIQELTIITGQKAVATISKKDISNFKLRKKMPIGVMVTLRREKMYEFFERLIRVALPRIRDFKGIKSQLDGRGNYTLGIQEQIIFPEINIDNITRLLGMNITFVTSAKTDEEGFALLKEFGLPFK